MTEQSLIKVAKLAPIVERVHGTNHPELTRVRELIEALQLLDNAAQTSDLFTQLRAVTNNYTTPGDACEAYTETYELLKLADAAQGGGQGEQDH